MWLQLGEQNQIKNSILHSFEKYSSVFECGLSSVSKSSKPVLKTRFETQFSEQIQQNQFKNLILRSFEKRNLSSNVASVQ
jgi:hypothetical protein